MKLKQLCLLSLTFALLGTWTSSSWAKDMQGRAGVGIEETLGGVSGLTLRYWPGQSFGVSLTAGAKIVRYEGESAKGDTEFKFATLVSTSAGFMANIGRSLHANLSVGARISIGFLSDETNDIVPAEASRVQFSVELPLQLEFFLSDAFSISVATGVLFAFIPDEGPTLPVASHAALERPNSLIIDLGAGSVTSSLGIVYYF